MTHAEHEFCVSLDTTARHFDRDEVALCSVGNVLDQTTFVFDGYGSIARPMSVELARRGASRIILVDPKRYVSESIDSQCTAEEVGKLKVDVGAERLRQLGAEVKPFARDLESVPEGIVDEDAIVITSVDNRRADILSNRRANRMRARLIKVNVEPAYEMAAVRAYDFRQGARLCVECQFSAHHYAKQRHPKSCDGTHDERRTNSPRWLSQAAAFLGVLAAIDTAADQAAAQQWLARERQYFPRTGAVRDSCLESRPNCQANHACYWRNVVRLRENSSATTLRKLFQCAAIAVDAHAQVLFCQQVALRSCCRHCRRDFPIVRWFADLAQPVGVCPSCAGPLLAAPFAIRRSVSPEPLRNVLDHSLAEWGVEPFAVIELSRHEQCTTFVVGGG